MQVSVRRMLGLSAALFTILALLRSPLATPVTAQAGPVRINEVESSGGTPSDWVELINTSGAPVDVSGWKFLDNDNTHTKYSIPNGASIPAGGYLVLEEAQFGFGLGSADSAQLFAADGTTIVDTYSWTAHATTTYGRCPNGAGAFATTASSTKGAANDCSNVAFATVKINEVESSGGTPGDWVELINTGTSAADVSGWKFLDDDNTHTAYVIANGASIPAGGFLVLDEAQFIFGLGSADTARLFAPDGTTLIDSYSWTAHAATTYGRCPDGTGAFTSTTASMKGTANACPGVITAQPWPGDAAITTADGDNVLGGNMSGLAYEPTGTAAPGVLWAVKNGPGTLFRLIWNGTIWTPDPAWSATGKPLRYTDGAGDPDAEGVTFATGGPANGLYVSTERNNAANSISRPAVLLFNPNAAGTTLTATREWNLTPDLPGLGPNLGLEAITWLPDSFLVAGGFFDESKGHTYSPAEYPNHGAGLFFVGVEASGAIYAYALNHADSTYTRIATIASGFSGVMELQFDRELGKFWAVCDDTCQGRHALLTINNQGRFAVSALFDRPAGMPNLNNEGFTFASEAECNAARKPAIWADDSNTGGHALRQGTVPCAASVAADLAITKSAPAQTNPNQQFAYTLTVTNNGPSTATGVVATDTLPANVALIAMQSTRGNCARAGRVITVTCTLGTLDGGGSVTITITVQTPTPAVLTNTATVTAAQPDPVPANNSSTAQTAACGQGVNCPPPARYDLALTKTAAPAGQVLAGGQIVYTLTVTNIGNATATGAVLTDPLPAGVTFVSATTSPGTCLFQSGTVTCALGSVPAGASMAVTLTVTAPAQAATLVNTATVAATTPDPNTGNNSAAVTNTVATCSRGACSPAQPPVAVPTADVSVALTATPNPVANGGVLTYQATVSNTGPNPTDGTTLKVVLDSWLTVGAVTPATGNCTVAGTTVSCNLGSIAATGAVIVNITATAPAQGPLMLSSSASATGTAYDPNTGNNSSVRTTSVGVCPRGGCSP